MSTTRGALNLAEANPEQDAWSRRDPWRQGASPDVVPGNAGEPPLGTWSGLHPDTFGFDDTLARSDSAERARVLLQLQGTHGNSYVQRLVQRQPAAGSAVQRTPVADGVTVNQPDDPLEQTAEQTAASAAAPLMRAAPVQDNAARLGVQREVAEQPRARAEAPAQSNSSASASPACTTPALAVATGPDVASPPVNIASATPPPARPAGPAAGSSPVATAPTDAPAVPVDGQEQLTPESAARLAQVQHNASAVAAQTADLPPASDVVADARGAVQEPSTETQARAQGTLVAALDDRQPPSPEIEQLCQHVYDVIRSKRPPDEDSLVDARPDEMATEAGAQLNGDVEADARRVAGSYQAINQPTTAAPAQQPRDCTPPPDRVETPPMAAESAVPDPVPPEEVSIDAERDDAAQRIEQAGMRTPAAQLVQSGPIADARAAQGELGEMAERDPAEVLAQQAATLEQARTDMASLQQSATQALAVMRTSTVDTATSHQAGMVTSEEQMRAQISEQAARIFATAQQAVNQQLEPLPRVALDEWNAGVAMLSREFKDSLARVKRWIDERHEGFGGSLLAAWDWATGLPDWVTDEYDAAEQKFGDGACALIRDISSHVNGVIATCQGIISSARDQINQLFTNLPAELGAWAAEQQASFTAQFDGLEQRTNEARDHVTHDLAQTAAGAVQDVRQQVKGLREAAGGLLGRIADAVNRFLDDPVKFIIDGLLSLLGIPPAAFWGVVQRIGDAVSDIADDPLGFANNLVAALGQGFSQFFDHIGQHLLEGLMGWLLSGLRSVGIQLPADTSLKSIITFFLQLMGITWANIRRVIAEHVGEENVALVERAWQTIAQFIDMGPAGIFELLKERLDPQNLLGMVLDAAVNYIKDAVITAVTPRIIALFNPAGAILEAIEAIYHALKWVFHNAARIFSLVETVVNGITRLMQGDIGGMATAIEGALTGLLGPVIDFLADYLGFGDLPGEIANLIRGLQQQVMDALESVVGFVVEGARGLLGMGGGQGPAAGAGGGDGEIGETVAFSDVDEEHRLWVQTEGAQATLMVASETPAPVQEKLSTWSRSDQLGKVPDQTDDGGRPRDEARSLIDAARALLGQGDQQADALARALQQAHTLSTGSAPPDTERLDNSLEATEHALSTILARLFTIFKQKPNLQVIYAHQVERADPNARAAINRYLSPGSERERPDGIEQRWELAKQWLEQQPAVRDMLSGPLNSSHEFGTAAVSGQAIPALRDALAANGLDSSFCGTGADSVSAYVENRKGIIHQALPPFARSRAELGEQVFDADHRPQADATLTREFTARVRDDKFSHLNRPDIARALEDVSKGEGWVAAFATGGIMLRSAPGADAPPLTLGDVWRSMERSTADVIATVSDAVQRTIAADPSFTGLLGGRTAEDAAVDIARQIVSNMGNATLYIVRHTEIPRYVEPGAHVLINADGESRNSALYASIAARSRDAALSQLAGEIHHVVPLYAGGGHVETNLMRAEGDARIAADAAETAHHVMHQFIDDLEITRYMDNLKVRLREPDLRREFPDDVIKIMIGVLYSDGHIDYSETDLMYKVSLDSKGLP